MADTRQRVKLTGLWKNTIQSGKNEGEVYLAGNNGAVRYVAFKNGFKDKDNDPDYILYVEQKQSNGERKTGGEDL